MLKADDTINGAEGTATMIVDGRVEELFEARSVEATVELNVADIRTLGNRMTQHKPTGASGSGSMTIYYISSRFARMVVDYLKTGRIPKFDLIVKNEDPSSATGKQLSKLSGCLINGADLGRLDIESDALETTVDFTFDDADLLQEFNAIN